ncbi:MAG: ATP-binding protein [Candidatus Paceibacterota bacterium]|jgi:signal transduction histidine kinase
MNLNICPDSIPSFLHFFDLSIAPPLLYYAYIPAILLSLFFGFFVFKKNNYSLQSKLLLGIAIAFAVWVFNLMFQWMVAYVKPDMFSWQITPFIEIFIPILVIYFAYVFLNKKDISLIPKIIFSILILITAITLPTKFNTLSFDLQNCQANYGNIYYYFIYIFELLAIFIVGYISFKKYLITPKGDQVSKREALIFGVGSVIFLTIFYLSNILGEITKTYQINLFGPIGLIVFIGFMSFMIVRYGLFNIKLIGAQALVWALVILVGSQFLYMHQMPTSSLIITGMTLIISAIVGLIIIRSVKKEIAQKEHIEKIAGELQIANEAQSTTLRFITHQINGVFTNTKAGLARLIEGDLDPISEPVKELANDLYKMQVGGVESVQVFLTVSQFESGGNPCIMKPVDIKEMISVVGSQLKTKAEKEKHLTYEINLPDNGNYIVMADKTYLSNSLFNLIDNAIRYTATGSIKIGLKKIDEDSVLFSVKDTGQGISEEDQKVMFTKYGHGKKSREVNVNSNGLGLYLVKLVAEAHKGKVWFETTIGKGTTFYVKLPLSAKLSV